MSILLPFKMTGRPHRLAALLALTGLVAIPWAANGCGTNAQTVRLNAAFDRTGTLRSDGDYDPMLDAGVLFVGDIVDNLALRAFVSVTLGAIPPGANVTKVLLHLEGGVLTGNPFGDFVTLSVDHVNAVAGIMKDNFQGGSITSSIATIPPLPTDGMTTQIVELDVTAQVKADIAAGRPISSFRLQFNSAPTADNQADAALFAASPDDPALQPYATATIQP